MSTQEQEIKAVEAEHLLQVYRRIPLVFARGEGSYLFDTNDRPYLDFVSGLGVASLGHANPDLAAAVADQARTLIHTSNLYFHPLQGEVGQQLTTLSGLARAFFCNSGTEAVEGCLKFARRYWYTRGEPRTRVVALDARSSMLTVADPAAVDRGRDTRTVSPSGKRLCSDDKARARAVVSVRHVCPSAVSETRCVRIAPALV